MNRHFALSFLAVLTLSVIATPTTMMVIQSSYAVRGHSNNGTPIATSGGEYIHRMVG
jgi:hypothetical protein